MLFDQKFWIGRVYNNNDIEHRGRVQVRIIGVHPGSDSSSQENPTLELGDEDLPWAMCLFPVTYGGVAGATCPPPQVMKGAYVVGISTDGDEFQNLIILGVLGGSMCSEALQTGQSLTDDTTTSDSSSSTQKSNFEILWDAIKTLATDNACADIFERVKALFVYLKKYNTDLATALESSTGLDLSANIDE